MPPEPTQKIPFRFSLFVPALSYNGGWAKCYSKGHLGPNRRGKYADTDEVYAWVNRITSYAMAKRAKLQLAGTQFPHRGPVQCAALFVFNRPHTQREGPPIIHASDYAVGDVDGLQKALGDAIIHESKNARYPKAGIIQDDRLIVRWLDPQKAFIDQVDWQDQKPGAGVWFRVEEYDDEPINIGRYV
jgi:hypothetical protein